jgi:hypothetical protein
MYSQGGYRFRADLSGAVMEASAWESGLIGLRAAPVVNVDVKDGQYPKFTLAASGLLKREASIRRAPGGRSARGSIAYSYDTYSTEERSYELPLDKTVAKDTSRFFNAAMVNADLCKRKILLEHEISVAAMTFSTSNYGSATNSDTAYTIANIASFDLGLDVDAAKERLRAKGEGDSGLTVVLSSSVFNRAKASTKLQNRLRGIGVSSDTILGATEEAVAEALGVGQVLVGKNYYDTAGELATASTSAIWSNTYAWVGRVEAGGSPEQMLRGGAQYTINWGEFGPVLAVFEYDEPQSKSTIIGAEQHVVEKVVNANAGTLIATQYS